MTTPATTKVRFTTKSVGPWGHAFVGEVRELPAKTAAKLVSKGYAIEADPSAAVTSYGKQEDVPDWQQYARTRPAAPAVSSSPESRVPSPESLGVSP